MKGFFIEITNNLLEPKHIKAMGSAIWEFMWCLDKITRTDESGVGWVYGGKPIKRENIRQELGKNISHISENLNKLKDAGYIVITRTPHGLVIGVNKAKKRYSQKATPEIAKRQHQKSEKATSNIRQDNRTRHKDNIPLYIPPLKNGQKKYGSPKDITEEDLKEIAERYKVSLGFVRLQFEKLKNYCEAKGRHYKNYKSALSNFVLGDMQKAIERRLQGDRKRGIDARNL